MVGDDGSEDGEGGQGVLGGGCLLAPPLAPSCKPQGSCGGWLRGGPCPGLWVLVPVSGAGQ